MNFVIKNRPSMMRISLLKPRGVDSTFGAKVVIITFNSNPNWSYV